jgi:Rps23 Pro-64 3,4-dihydroxylase Tpa1-like proline 4-hydroxylase
MSGNAAPVVRFEQFLVTNELESLVQFVVAHERSFVASRVMEGESPAGIVNRALRQSRVLNDPGAFEPLFAARLSAAMPEARRVLGIEPFRLDRIEMQIAAYEDGGFFGRHRDTDPAHVPSRTLTFVYFFFCGERRFRGGELRLYHVGGPTTIVPEQNVLVIFPSGMLHEVLPVDSPSRAFADCRFTITGWLHRDTAGPAPDPSRASAD